MRCFFWTDSFCSFFAGIFAFVFFFAQQHLLWMLPVEVWQEVLGCCSFHEYARADLVGRPASREFYSSSSRCWNCALAASSLDP